MPKRGVALVGLGMAVAPHAKSLLELKDRVEVIGAFSPSDARRRAFAERFPFPLANRLEDLLSDSKVETVMLLTPPDTHLDLVRRCAAARKHVLLEKPLEVSTARAEELVEVARGAGIALGVVLQHRFRPAVRKRAAILTSGDLGRIVACSAATPNWRPQSYYDQPGRGTRARDGGGVLLTQAIHTLDLILSLAGSVRDVCGFAATTPVHRMETEDLVCAAIRFENGALGTINATTAAYPGFPERIEILAERGTARLSGTELTVLHHDGRVTEHRSADSGGTGADPMAFPNDYHRELLADFLDAIEQGRAPTITGADALRVHRLIDALLETGETGRPVVVRHGKTE